MKKALLSFALFASIFITKGQDVVNGRIVIEPSNLNHEIGLAAGFSTGYGLSYRYWPKKVGVQLTMSPYKTNETSDFSLGVTGLLDLHSYNRYRFFLYLGNHYRYHEEKITNSYYDYQTNVTTQTTSSKISKDYTVGFGPGMEFLLGERVGFNLMFGYMASVNENNDLIYSPTVESGLYFRF